MSQAHLPGPVREVCDGWLAGIDARAPGLVEGLYLRGGLAFGEWFAGRSDVDFVATLSRRPSDGDVDAIEDSHAALGAEGVPFDGLHLLADDLARPPARCPDVSCVLHHHFEASPGCTTCCHRCAHHQVGRRALGAGLLRRALPPGAA